MHASPAELPDVPFFCEENVWRALQLPTLPWPVPEGAKRHAVFISNRRKAVAMWSQRAAVVDPIVWDYHVVLLAKAEGGGVIVDVDCTAGRVLPLRRWVETSFRSFVPEEAKPRFRVVDAVSFLRSFSSDRSHMRGPDGSLTKPPPPWEPPWQPALGMNLMKFVNVEEEEEEGEGAGFCCSLDELIAFAEAP